MLNYGTAAQDFFGYKTNIPMNESLSDAQMELAAATAVYGYYAEAYSG